MFSGYESMKFFVKNDTKYESYSLNEVKIQKFFESYNKDMIVKVNRICISSKNEI